MDNKAKFARLIGKSQVEYMQADDELRRFAMSRAEDLFDDDILREEAVDEAMSGDKDSLKAWLLGIANKSISIEGIPKPWGYAKTIISNRLKKLSKERTLRGVSLKSKGVKKQLLGLGLFPTGDTIGYEDGVAIEEETYGTGYSAYQISGTTYEPKGFSEFPRIWLDAIDNEDERAIMVEHYNGLKQGEIATKLGISKQRVNYVEMKYLKPKKKRDLSYQQPTFPQLAVSCWFDYLLPLETVLQPKDSGGVKVKRWSSCPLCKGGSFNFTTKLPLYKCKVCDGTGTVIEEVALSSMTKTLQKDYFWQVDGKVSKPLCAKQLEKLRKSLVYA